MHHLLSLCSRGPGAAASGCLLTQLLKLMCPRARAPCKEAIAVRTCAPQSEEPHCTSLEEESPCNSADPAEPRINN